jgi:hypothetical protein
MNLSGQYCRFLDHNAFQETDRSVIGQTEATSYPEESDMEKVSLLVTMNSPLSVGTRAKRKAMCSSTDASQRYIAPRRAEFSREGTTNTQSTR